MEILRDINCTIDTPVVYGNLAEAVYGRGVVITPRFPGKQGTKIYLAQLLPLEQYDRIYVLYSGGKDSTAAYYYLRELGVPKEKIELWHHDLDGGHPNRIMDWPVTMAYVDSFAKAEGVRLRVSRRVNGYYGEVYRIGASYPVEYEDDDGTFVQCDLSAKQYESDALRQQIMNTVMPVDETVFENSAELNRAWCARYEELLLQDIVTVEMDKLDKDGNKREFPHSNVREYISELKHQNCHLLQPVLQGAGRRFAPDMELRIDDQALRGISALKNLQPFHLRLPAIQSLQKGRYCTSVGKDKVFNRTAINLTRKQERRILVVSGERRGESRNRAQYNEMELHSTNATKRGNRLVHWWRPVIDHSEKDVWERLRRNRCVPHPCYACGWNRCSCMLCIFSKREQWAGIRELFPLEFERAVLDEKILGFNMHIGQSLEEYVGDAVSCVCRADPVALYQLVNGVFNPEDVYTDNWTYPAGAFHGSEGGPC